MVSVSVRRCKLSVIVWEGTIRWDGLDCHIFHTTYQLLRHIYLLIKTCILVKAIDLNFSAMTS